jgi:hypothetical protein
MVRAGAFPARRLLHDDCRFGASAPAPRCIVVEKEKDTD